MIDVSKEIEALIKEAAKVPDRSYPAPEAAMKYTQAALNAANAMLTVNAALKKGGD